MDAYVPFCDVRMAYLGAYIIINICCCCLHITTYLVRVETDYRCCTDEGTRRRSTHTGIRKDKMRKVASKAQIRQENRTQGVRSNIVSRLCYKAEPGTLSHYMPPSSCSRRQRYQIILVVGDDLKDFLHLLLVVYGLQPLFILFLSLIHI